MPACSVVDLSVLPIIGITHSSCLILISMEVTVIRNTGNLQASEFNDRTVNINFWTIQDAETVKRVELIPGSNDRLTGDFARWDVAVRQWEQLETNRWIWSARGEIGELFNDGKISIRADIVLWYVSHLPDLALEGNVKWHSFGPRIRVVQTSFYTLNIPVNQI